jgi:predicted RNase H-like nuclease
MNGSGVDGCRAGWFIVTFCDNGTVSWGIHKTFDELMRENPEASLILVDIPIGLPALEPRRCDSLARGILGGTRSSSVYPVPCREAVYASSFAEANVLNRNFLGRGLSVQTWNICGRIREADEYLRSKKGAGPAVRESHPEVCFRSLSYNEGPIHSKKTVLGIQERIEILQALFTHSERLYRSILGEISRKDIAPDDILDAMVLAISSHSFHNRLVSIPPDVQTDEYGIAMEMVYPKPD